MFKKYVVICQDRDDSQTARAASLSDHLRHLEQSIDRIHLAAALKDQSDAFSGSIMVVDASDADDARHFVEQDPFFAAGVWRKMDVHRLGGAVGSWVESM